METRIRPMRREDVEALLTAFAAQGWEKPRDVLEGYFTQQEAGVRSVFVAEWQGKPAGYVTLLRQADTGPFAGQGVPEIADFNVFVPYRRQGVGTLLLDAAEARAARLGPQISLGVGLHAGYGAAQRLYTCRGYVPDGSGVWYQDRPLPAGAPCKNDDDLILYFVKTL